MLAQLLGMTRGKKDKDKEREKGKGVKELKNGASAENTEPRAAILKEAKGSLGPPSRCPDMNGNEPAQGGERK
ncbi:unnamed protein product, partial [Discosporangium mesarthrocarpum]